MEKYIETITELTKELTSNGGDYIALDHYNDKLIIERFDNDLCFLDDDTLILTKSESKELLTEFRKCIKDNGFIRTSNFISIIRQRDRSSKIDSLLKE